MLERIGNCRIVDEVAAGGMAVVYRAIQDALHRTVAIKALKSELCGDAQLTRRFEREAEFLAALQHENIINVYDFYREDDRLFIVMEYVEGIDIYDLLDKCGRLPFDVATIIAIEVARALDYVHYRAVIHRDIKPANIMISRPGGVKLMDFGIAQDHNLGEDLTQTGTGIGTPSYMSPEQILGDKLDASSDVFSLGIVLYQMVTGRKPFIEDEERSVMNIIRLQPHTPARKLNPEIPRELERIIDKCLQKDPKDRWRSGQSLVMALQKFLSKYVEMNYQTRLVLFLKSQDVLTQLEADEYLSPKMLAMGNALSQSKVQARRQMHHAIVVQGAILAIAALMVGLIHLAPVGAKVPAIVVHSEPETGFVQVIANPWAEVFIDGVSVGLTPMAAPLQLEVGGHDLVLRNEFYPPHFETLEIAVGGLSDAYILRVDLDIKEQTEGS
ncbi:MAG: serine/threonine protein kinase [Myxococcales bacterium]|nr:serine/threonine protein kinase [Myxococcales bacterium]